MSFLGDGKFRHNIRMINFQSKNFTCHNCKTEQHDGTFIKTDKNPNWRYICCNCIAKELDK